MNSGYKLEVDHLIIFFILGEVTSQTVLRMPKSYSQIHSVIWVQR